MVFENWDKSGFRNCITANEIVRNPNLSQFHSSYIWPCPNFVHRIYGFRKLGQIGILELYNGEQNCKKSQFVPISFIVYMVFENWDKWGFRNCITAKEIVRNPNLSQFYSSYIWFSKIRTNRDFGNV